MKAVFIYTNSMSPKVDVYPACTKVEEATVDSLEQIKIYYTTGDPSVISIDEKPKADGQLAIFWE